MRVYIRCACATHNWKALIEAVKKSTDGSIHMRWGMASAMPVCSVGDAGMFGRRCRYVPSVQLKGELHMLKSESEKINAEAEKMTKDQQGRQAY